MAGASRFPLKNQVDRAPREISAACFRHHFLINGYRDLAPCLKATPPQRASADGAKLGEWEVDCNGSAFYFSRIDGSWRHTGFENVNE